VNEETSRVALKPTAGQTVGPFFGYALPYEGGPEVVPPYRADAVLLHGVVYDGAGAGIPDALLEIWQADASGRISKEPGSFNRDARTFTGFGRAATDAVGHYQFSTVVPGPVTEGGAPFIAVTIFARGLLDNLYTRIYLPENEDANARDPLLASLSDAERATLIAVRDEDGNLRHDIHLQGEKETVFLEFRR